MLETRGDRWLSMAQGTIVYMPAELVREEEGRN
jgi:hypothetical protein